MSKAINYHTIIEFQRQCRRRIPNIAFSYLESGTENEKALDQNINQFDSIRFIPKFCLGQKMVPDLKTEILGQEFLAPIGIAPVGLTGLIWPKAEAYLAKLASKKEIPFCLSTVATMSPEEVDDLGVKSKVKWFQLYPPKDLNILDSLLQRIKDSGFSHLVVTVDIPAPSRRERSKSAGLSMPLKITLKLVIDGLKNPRWLLSMLKEGMPRLRTVESYTNNNGLRFVSNFVGNRLGGTVDWKYLEELRAKWQGQLIIKGILHPDDALKAKEIGLDAVYVSNHGGRQFDGSVSPLEQLVKVRKALGPDYPVFYDSGIRSGLDIMKAIYAGADFVFVGRPFMYGVGAYQYSGVNQVFEILVDQLRSNMMQLGLESVSEIRSIPENLVETSKEF